ncbi:vacuole membrane protein 1-like isoform X4 [Cimex lectularius]|nr:vacuole membrane protein 1-like isoform X4 [Cimex lectularius]XP_014239596.1 vacuole membrane protein 1-like isoform X4 [Cimex lectularius]XP_024084243.1 vacuole membrane protein 1-like isoform X4 [Cimex lectularius]
MKRKGELASNGESNKEIKVVSKSVLREERENLVLWRRPFTTTLYFLQEFTINIYNFGTRTLQYRKCLVLGSLVLLVLTVLMNIHGPHQSFLQFAKKKIFWSAYWLGLGVLSSIGLGTGLHTFLLYLGPHIASVTLAAYECGGLNFPEPPYPDDIICPDTIDTNWTVSIWNIIRKVHLEAIMWGAGTALGELPPYFMARAARLSGHDPEDDEDLKEFEELQKKKKDKSSMSTLDKVKLLVEDLVNKVGFVGILVCASIPNPLFDLAGITCGHFLVPFWTFFGATLIGKAVIKMMIQTMFVIVAFSDVLISVLMDILGKLPAFGDKLQNVLEKMLQMQRAKLHRGSQTNTESSGNPIGMVFEMFVLVMVGYFVISIINSLAQNYHKRISKNDGSEKKNKEY